MPHISHIIRHSPSKNCKFAPVFIIESLIQPTGNFYFFLFLQIEARRRRRQKVVPGGLISWFSNLSVSQAGGGPEDNVGNTMSNIFHSINLMECLHPSTSTNMRINQIRSRRFLGRWRLLRMQGKKVTVTCNGTHCR